MGQGENGQNNMMKYMANPKAFTIRKWLYDLLKLQYSAHDEIVERVSTSLSTDRDLTDFGNLMSQVYEAGYRKAVDDYRSQIEGMGLKIHIVQPEPSEPS